MRSFRLTIGLAIACATLHAAVAVAMPTTTIEKVPIDPVSATRALIKQGDSLIDARDPSEARVVYASAIESAGFAQLSTVEQHALLSVAGSLAVEQEQTDIGLAWLKRATGFEEATAGDWHNRLAAAFRLSDYTDSALCISTIAKRWPSSLDQIRVSAIYAVDQKLEADHATSKRRELLESLFVAEWTEDGHAPNSQLIDLALMMIADGERQRAAKVIERIDSPRYAVILRVDRRFDRTLRVAKRKIDIEQISAASLARARERVEAAPTLLAPRVALQSALLQLMKHDEVLAIADEAMARTRDIDGESVFTDFKVEYIWILNNRARALQGLGRWDDALEQLKNAARRPEGGDLNVSQAINLGLLLASLNRSAEAREAIAELGGISDFGRMLVEFVGLMTAAQDKDSAAVDKHLAYLSEHRAPSPGVYGNALLDVDRLDDAAKLLIERLRREDWRSDALKEMQIYAEQLQTPRGVIQSARWRAVIARADVQAELAKVGRIEHFKLSRP